MTKQRIVALDTVAEINPRLPIDLRSDDTVSFVPMADVVAETGTTDVKTTRRFREIGSGYTPFANGDILVAKITPCFENGKIAQAALTHPCGFGSSEFHVIRARRAHVDPRFLLHFLRQPRVRDEGERRMTGSAGQRRVPAQFLASLQIPLPPLPEQRSIAAILDQADELRAKRRAVLGSLDALEKFIFVDMFGDSATNPKSLPSTTLGALIKLKSGDFLPAKAMSAGGAFPVFGGNGINGYHDEFMFEEPKIVIGRVGAYCGCVHVSQRRCWVTDNALYVSEQSDNIEIEYLSHALRHANLNQYASQSGQPLVSGARIYPVEILVPPLRSQREYARRICGVRELKTAMDAAMTEMGRLFSSLQHRAFRGEL